MSGHTLGPWAAKSWNQETGDISVTNEKQRIVIAVVTNAASAGAYMLGKYPATQWANASLVAAAPDLLAALSPMIAFAEAERQHLIESFAVARRAEDGTLTYHEDDISDGFGRELIAHIDAILAPARAAIAKAEGRA